MGLFDFLKPRPKELYTGGDGSSTTRAVIINARTTNLGVLAEYLWIEKRYGKRDQDWKLLEGVR